MFPAEVGGVPDVEAPPDVVGLWPRPYWPWSTAPVVAVVGGWEGDVTEELVADGGPAPPGPAGESSR
jgi:hypothetical protein